MSEENQEIKDAEIVLAGPARGTVRWPIATDIVNKATATLPEYEREQFRWLQRYALGADAIPTDIVVRLTKPDGSPYSWDSVYQTLTGKRAAEGASMKPMADAISRFRKMVREVESRSATEFIETPQTRLLFRIFKRALDRHRVAFVMGDSQIGKTTAGVEFQRLNNHGLTHILRMPTQGSLGNTLAEFATRLGIRSRIGGTDLRRRIFESFDENNLLIVDEAHQGLIGRTAQSGAISLEFIRELHDRRGCGIVLMGTAVLREGLKHNRVLSQMWRRRSPGLVINLPSEVPRADLDCFAAAFGLEAAPDREMRIQFDAEGGSKSFGANPLKIQTEIVRADGLGSWIRLLEDARDLARETNARMSWGRVLVAYCQAQANEG
jgi:DNA transposition AAA+ family ATPase